MDPSLMSAAISNLSMASTSEMAQMNFSLAKMAMRDEEQSAARLLEMLPDSQGALRLRGPQPGDVPEVMKGSYFDIYA